MDIYNLLSGEGDCTRLELECGKLWALCGTSLSALSHLLLYRVQWITLMILTPDTSDIPSERGLGFNSLSTKPTV